MSLHPPTPRPRVLTGAVLEQTGQVLRELGWGRVLIVADPAVVAAGHLRPILADLDMAHAVYDRVRPEPTVDDVDACLAALRAFGPDGLLAVGGGSAIDTAKAAALLATNEGPLERYRGYDQAPHPALPLVAAPSTAGTGSELQSYALVALADHTKAAIGGPSLRPKAVLLDPRLPSTSPRLVAAMAGLDALAHAVEAAVTAARTPDSVRLAHQAFALVVPSLERVLTVPTDLDAWSALQQGAALAGEAIEGSMLGAAHATANPISARFGLAHGEAVIRTLPAVIRFNAEDPEVARGLEALARAAGLTGVDAILGAIHRLVLLGGLPTLRERGLTPDHLPDLARAATTQWTGRFNPVPVDEAAFLAIYRDALR